MRLENLVLREQTAQGYSEGIEYSPPKDIVDSEMFRTFFANGSYPLARNDLEKVSLTFPSIVDGSDVESCEVASIADSVETGKKSDYGSLKTCAHTLASTSKSPAQGDNVSQLAKRTPNLSKAGDFSQYQLTSQISPSNKANTEVISENEIFLRCFIDREISNKNLTKLAIRLVDRSQPMSCEEWKSLSQQEKATLLSYMEKIYDVDISGVQNPCTRELLDYILSKPLKAKRNDEKLKKTVKKVNSMITKAFIGINNLQHLPEKELEEAVYSAYFGNKTKGGNTINIFSSRQAFSQKVFGKVVSNQRYAEDFETIINTLYIPDFLKSRQKQVYKSIAFIRRKLDGHHENIDTVLNEAIKRAPWTLSDIVEGVELCQTLISKSKLF